MPQTSSSEGWYSVGSASLTGAGLEDLPEGVLLLLLRDSGAETRFSIRVSQSSLKVVSSAQGGARYRASDESPWR